MIEQASKALLKAVSSFLVSLGLISILFSGSAGASSMSGLSALDEESLNQKGNETNPPERVVDPSLDNQNTANQNSSDGYPDLGSDQVFPFIAGLDSYQ